MAGTGGTALELHFTAMPELVDLGKRPYAVAGQPKKTERVRGLTAAEFGFVLLELPDRQRRRR